MENESAQSGSAVRRKAKDSVFTHLFQDKEYLLQLYQALHPEDTKAEEKHLTIITLKNILQGAYITTWVLC